VTQTFDVAKSADSVGGKPITPEGGIDGWRNKAVLAINQNAAARDARELGGCFNGIDGYGIGLERLDGERISRFGRRA
jgi:hypothetical protein